MDSLSSALTVGASLINNVAKLLSEESERWRQELQHREGEANRRRDEAVLSAARQVIEQVGRYNEETAKERQEAALQMEAAAKMREEAARAEAEKAKEALRQGTRLVARLVMMPTPKQFSAAKERIQFNPEKLHFAVCGTSGSGKSSIVNSVRGLRDNSDDAARVGVTECMSEIIGYPDPRKDPPYSRFVWYDIPGAETTADSDWQYFTDQGLSVFDVIILVYDDRFTAIDVGIIENCLRFNIPVLIVRSKADQHIANMMQARNCEPGDEDYDEVYGEMAERYVEATRSDFDKHMKTMADVRDRKMMWNQRVYIVAAETLRDRMVMPGSFRQLANDSKIIDENLLLDDIVQTVDLLRCFNQSQLSMCLPAVRHKN